MAKATVLFADNDPDFLKTRSEYIEQNGYEVIPASDLTKARMVIERGDIDLAILDIRMVDDADEKDTSGLTLAREMKQPVPTIILTAFPSVDLVRESLKPQLDGLPAAVDFLSKKEGPQALIWAIRRALGPGSMWLRKVKDAIAGTEDELIEDHDNAQRQAVTFFRASLSVAIIGIALIFIGIALVYWQGLEIGVASTISGIVTEVVSYLFFKRADVANERMDHYHRERITGHRFETLLQACDAMNSERKREHCREHVIMAATSNWLNVSDQGSVAQDEEEPKGKAS